MALFSLVLLFVAVVLGFIKKMNIGLLCIAFSLVLGRIAGFSDKAIIAGFNYSLFMTLLGVTYLFALAQNNGCMTLAAKKVVALAGKRTFLVPIFVYLFCVFLSSIGPGCIPTMAIMLIFAMTLAAEMNINPVMLTALCVLGASGGGVSPIAPTGIIGVMLSEEVGVHNVAMPMYINGLISTTLYAIVVYFVFGGHKLKSQNNVSFAELPAFNVKQWITIGGIFAMVVLVIGFGFNVGLTSFFIAMILSILNVSNEADAVRSVPWGTLVLVGGVSVLMNLIIKLDGIKMLSVALASVMTPSTATPILSISAGILSWFSSTSGVVMPTFIPTIPTVVAEMQGNCNPVELITALTMIAHTAGISPMSTGGGLGLAAYCGAVKGGAEQQQKLFLQLFLTSACAVLFLSFMAYLGLFRWFI